MFPIPRAKVSSSIGHNTDELSDRGLDDVTFPDDGINGDGMSMNGGGGGGTIPSWMSLLERRDIQQNLNAFGMALGRKNISGNSTIDLSPFSAKSSTTGSVINPVYEPTPFFTLPHSIESFSIDGDKRSDSPNRTRNTCLVILLLFGLLLAIAAICTGTLYTVVDQAPNVDLALNINGSDILPDTTTPVSSSSSSSSSSSPLTTISTTPTTTITIKEASSTTSATTASITSSSSTLTTSLSSSLSTSSSTTTEIPTTTSTTTTTTLTPEVPTTTSTTTTTTPETTTSTTIATTSLSTTPLLTTTTTKTTTTTTTVESTIPETTKVPSTTAQPTTPITTTAQPTTVSSTTPQPTTKSTTAATTTSKTTTTTINPTTIETTTPTTTTTTTTAASTTQVQATTTTSTTIATTTEEATTSTPVITTTEATISTTENTTTIPPPIYIVTNVTDAILYSPTNITCLWIHNETSGPIVVQGVDQEVGSETAIAAFMESGQHGSFYPGLFSTAISNTTEGQLLMTTTILNTSCLDASLQYQCSLLNDAYQKHLVALEVTVLPDVSITSSPRYVIENVIFQMKCKGMIGSSFGDVSLTAETQADGIFQPFPVVSETRSNVTVDSCSLVQEVTFDIRVTSSQNGSMLRCETEDPVGFSEEFTILVIAESICKDAEVGDFVAHPYEISQYVKCGLDPLIEVMTCDPGYVFDTVGGKCTDPFAADVKFLAQNFTENAALRLDCLVTAGNYSDVTLVKMEENAENILVVYHVDGTYDVTSPSHGNVSRSTEGDSTIMTSHVPAGKCGDVGTYACRHNNGKNSSGKVDIEIKPRPVQITIPEDLVESQTMIISCQGVVDVKKGLISLLSSSSEEEDTAGARFQEVGSSKFNREESTLSSDSCKSTKNVRFTGVASLSMNHTFYKCQTSTPSSSSASVEVLVIPGSACDGKTDGSLRAHPYDIHKYLACGLTLEVRGCEDSQVYSTDLTKCIESDAAVVSFVDTTVTEGDDLELVCSLSQGSYSLIGLHRLEGDGKQPISSFALNGTNNAVLSQRDVIMRRRIEGDNRIMATSLTEATCDDRGRYECSHDNGQRSKGNVTIYAKAPSDVTAYLEVNDWPVSDRPLTVHCLGAVLDKARGGQVVLQRSRDMEGPYDDVMVDTSVVIVMAEDDCKTDAAVTMIVSQLSLKEWNGTYIRCQTDFPTFVTKPQQVLVIQDTVCDGLVSGSLIPNPYSVNGYIRCFLDNLVFETCPDDKIWRQDLKNCAETDAGVVSMVDRDLSAEVADSVNITCGITIGSYLSVSLFHSQNGQKEEEIARFFPDGTDLVSSTQVKSAFRYTDADRSSYFVTTLSELKCQNGGTYICRHDNQQSSSGNLEVKVPSLITLTPESDYTPITSNYILCDGRVDLRSSGEVKLTQMDAATGQFTDSGIALTSSTSLESLDGCWERRQATFQTTFDLSFNNTDFRCETTSPVAVSEPFNVLVIPGDICLNEAIGSNIPHPYSKHKFIICFGNLFIAMPCPGEYYYNTALTECVDSNFATTSIQTPKEFISQDQLTITCLLTLGNFSTLTLSKLDDTGNDPVPIASIDSDLSSTIFYDSGDVMVNVTSETDEVRKFEFSIFRASCQNLGGYMCLLDNGQNKTDTVDEVTVLPSLKVLPEEDITPITSNYIICEGRLDLRSGGEIRLARKDQSTGSFVDAEVPIATSTVAEGVDGCWEYRQTTFQQTFELNWNNTELRCETTAPKSASESFTMLVVPGDICLSEGMASRIPHPYTNRKEILCFGDLYIIMACPGDYVFNGVVNGCSDPSIPVTKLEAPSSFTDLDDLRLTCRLSQGEFTTLTLLKIGETESSSELIAVLDSSMNILTMMPDKLRTALTIQGDEKRLEVDIMRASCGDDGLYMCLLDNGQNSTAEVSEVTVPASPIELSFQQDYISDTAYNVSCRAPVEGQKQFALQRSNSGGPSFEDSGLTPVYSNPTDTESKCTMQADFNNVYDMTWNGTLLRCQTSDQLQVSNAETMLVIPGNYCESFPIASPQPHPYTETKYIFCFGEFLSINPCPGNFVWRQEFQECLDPTDVRAVRTTSQIKSLSSSAEPFVAPTSSEVPLTTTTIPVATTTTKPPTTTVVIPAISVKSANYTLGARADVVCTVTDRGWNSVILVYVTEDGTDLLSSFTFDGSIDVAIRPGLVLSRSRDGGNVTLTTTFEDIRCTDEGRYLCSDDAGNSGEGTIGVALPAQDISMTPPPYMTSYEGSSFVCSGKVRSEGRLFFSVKFTGQDEYQELFTPSTSTATEVSEVTDCTKSVTLTMDFVFDMSYNGSHIRCESSDQSKTSDEFEMLILPSTFCENVLSGQVVEHPYSCQFYVTCLILRNPIIQACSPGLCYNIDLGFCQVKETDGATDSDPFSCQGKAASSYIPVLESCSEYTWCVNGQEIPGSCPPNTFFSSSSPPCSNIASEAFCSADELRLEGFDL